MARRRLSPSVMSADVPRAEHPDPLRAAPPALSTAPIARIAGDAAGNAALAEVSRELADARESGRLVLELPLDDIAPDHLTRDRIPAEDEEMASLRASIRAHGQRTPIEVTPLGKGDGAALPYGLISGWRRLAALKALFAETGEARFATIRALVRRPESTRAAYVAMVEENEIRVGLSQYERARVAALSVKRGIFETEKEALLTLFANASRPKRSRIRAFVEIYHALDGYLRFPAHLPERLGLKLVARMREGGAEEIARALRRCDPQTPEAELACLEKLLAAAAPKPGKEADSPGRSVEQLRDGVALEQSLRGRTLTLRLTGSEVGPELASEIRSAIAQLCSAPVERS